MKLGGYPHQQHYGGYPQYGGQYGGGHYGGYPGGGHHHDHDHGYGYRTTVQPDRRSHPCPHGRHQCPNGIVVSREQLATDPSLAAHVVPLGTGSMPGYHFAQQPVSSFNRQPKPQQPSVQPFNLPANPFASYYYQQLLKAQQNLPSPPAAVKYAPTSRFQPQVFGNGQQPRSFGYYATNI
jgi:hypothetical protein